MDLAGQAQADRFNLENKDSLKFPYPFQHRWQIIFHPVHSRIHSHDLPKERFHTSDINPGSFKQSL